MENKKEKESLIRKARQIEDLAKKRQALERKHGVIQFYAAVRRENKSLKVYIPHEKAKSIRLKEGDIIHVLLGKNKVD